MAFFVSVLSTMVLITLAPCANGLSKSYATIIWLSPTASLSFSAQRAKNQIDLALRLKAGAAAGTVSWLGIGIAEPSGGGMRGADIFTVQFQSASTCVPVDRNVPYVGFPLSAAPTAFPVPDAKNTTETWKLVACERGADGSVSLEVTRLLNVPAEGNPGDRSITAGQQQVLHAFGNTFTYHSLNRFSTEVTFFNDAANPPRPEPTGVDGTIVLSGDSNSAKDNPVTCFEMKAPTPPSGRMVVAVEAKVTSRAVTSILVYGCRDSAFFANFNGKAVCTTRSSSLLGLNQDAKCNTLFYSCKFPPCECILPFRFGRR